MYNVIIICIYTDNIMWTKKWTESQMNLPTQYCYIHFVATVKLLYSNFNMDCTVISPDGMKGINTLWRQSSSAWMQIIFGRSLAGNLWYLDSTQCTSNDTPSSTKKTQTDGHGISSGFRVHCNEERIHCNQKNEVFGGQETTKIHRPRNSGKVLTTATSCGMFWSVSCPNPKPKCEN